MTQVGSSLRIDKWLWAVRLYKTRSDAAEACRNNHVLINDGFTKPSREIKMGDVVSVKKAPVLYSFRVLELVSNRQPSKNVALYAENITPQSELDKLNIPKETVFIMREQGAGRPTKRDRREIDALMNDLYDTSDE